MHIYLNILKFWQNNLPPSPWNFINFHILECDPNIRHDEKCAMYPTFCSFRCRSIFICSSLFLCITCCKFLISDCLLSISAWRFFSSFSIFSFFRASRDASFWRIWISCWSYNNWEDESLSSAAFYLGKWGLSPLILLCLILKTMTSILLYPLLHRIFSEVFYLVAELKIWYEGTYLLMTRIC